MRVPSLDKFRVVTALYDIGRGNLNGQFKRSFETYKEWFAELLKTDLPLTIYCEKSLDSFIEQYRPIDKKTRAMHLDTETIRNHPYFAKVQKVRTNNDWVKSASWLKNSPQAALDLYNPLVMMKYVLLSLEFSAEYVLWLDAGVAATTEMNLLENLEERILPYLDKILFLSFPYRDTEIHGFPIEAMDFFAKEPVERVVRATLFGGPRKLLYDLYFGYERLLSETLARGFMGTEENLLTLMSYLVPEDINLHSLKSNPARISDFLSKI